MLIILKTVDCWTFVWAKKILPERDGDWLDHDTRYRRTDEYLEIVRRVWTAQTPFDYEDEFYRVKDAFSDVKPVQQPHIPLYFGGASGAAVPVGAKHSDVYAMWNAANYICRQHFFATGKKYSLTDLYHLTKDCVDYPALPTKVSKQIIKRLVSTWTGYFEAHKQWKKNPSQ